MTKKPNPDMIIIARESRGITQNNLAKLLSVSQGRISKIESGLLDNIPDKLLKKLSEVLNYPEEFFFRREQRFPLGLTVLFHRKRKSLPSKTLNKIEGQINVLRIHIESLLRSVELKDNKFFFADIDEYDGDVEKITKVVRNTWLLPRGPVKNITNAIENAGGLIFQCDFETNLLDALSFNYPGLPPLFFLNTRAPSDRIRFSLAHELGHLIMHRIPNPKMEKQADEFAGNFLMPREEIKHQLGSLNLGKLGELKSYWKVSMASLITRANELNKITDRQATYLWMQMGKAGYRRREPVEYDIPGEKPTTVQKIINIYQKELNYSINDLCKLLTINPSEFHLIYNKNQKKPHLIAVK